MMFMGFVGMLVLLGIGVACSVSRRSINLRTVGAALGLQVLIGAFVLYVPVGRQALESMSHGVHVVLDSGKAGIRFLFGNLVNFSVEGIGFVFALARATLTFLTGVFFLTLDFESSFVCSSAVCSVCGRQ